MKEADLDRTIRLAAVPDPEREPAKRPSGRPPCVDDDDAGELDVDYPDFDRSTTFVIAGALADFPPRPGEEGRSGFSSVKAARAWARRKYGRLHEGGRNLETDESGRYAFRVDKR